MKPEASGEEFIKHAKSDIAYIDGLQRHIEDGGTADARNVSDLIAMVRWNADLLIQRLEEPRP